MTAPLIFDRLLIRRRLHRAVARGYTGFLLNRALDDLDERLGTLTRRFPLAVDLGTPVPGVAARLRAAGRCDHALRLSPLAEPGEVGALADEETLPLKGESVDLVVSLLALHAVNDLPGSLVQIRRALRPDGLFLGCLLGGATLTELRQCLAEAEAELEGGVSPRVAPFADLRDLGGLLQRAGFALPVADLEPVRVRYGDPFTLMHDLRAMGLTNALVERRRAPTRRTTLFRAAELYAQRFSDPDGRLRATFDLVWLSGWAPHESQQKPLRPGSAKVRLAEALGVEQQSAGEKPS